MVSKILKKNFEPGRLLLVATLLLSMTLISQLYVMSESMDFSNGLQLDGVELSLAMSYVFSAISMVIVINEFFQIKTKMKGLLELNQLIDKTPVVEQVPVSTEIIPVNLMVSQEPAYETVEISEEIDEDQEFENLLETEFTENKSVDGKTLAKYRTKKVKLQEEMTKEKLEEETHKLEPILEEGALQNMFDDLEEESEMDRMLAESEVIATLAELEELVEELRLKKAPEIAQ
jgi:hypothetical protein